jgi:putative FmdB family regulatory protein
LPVYEYECPSCSNRFEIIRSFGKNGSVSCPKCGCNAQRIFTSVPVIFKGSGFYVTDHRGNNSQPKSTIGESDNGSGESGSSDSSKETAKTTGADDSD